MNTCQHQLDCFIIMCKSIKIPAGSCPFKNTHGCDVSNLLNIFRYKKLCALIFERKYTFKWLKKLLKFDKIRAENHSIQPELFIESLKILYEIPTIQCMLSRDAGFNQQLYLKFTLTNNFLKSFSEFLRTTILRKKLQSRVLKLSSNEIFYLVKIFSFQIQPCGFLFRRRFREIFSYFSRLDQIFFLPFLFIFYFLF